MNINYEKVPKGGNFKSSNKKSVALSRRVSRLRSKIVFLVPTKNLLEQQSNYFSTHLPSYFDVFHIKSSSEFSEGKKVFEEEARPTFVVMIHKVCLSLLRNGNMTIEELDFLIFDE